MADLRIFLSRVHVNKTALYTKMYAAFLSCPEMCRRSTTANTARSSKKPQKELRPPAFFLYHFGYCIYDIENILKSGA